MIVVSEARAVGAVAAPAVSVDAVSVPAVAAPPIAMVAVTRAPGLARVLESLGARIVRPGHGTRPSVGEIVEGILACRLGRGHRAAQ